ncbi:hypothetical protein [Nostoc sp. WHI]|uniref:hypothetical protein n=1 Tax=Nostoc sp. WHI TaxID=2650611 RepID=UPI0018C7C61C|nr:hypothetical protein [Nostoc sp. WHI]
MQVTVKELIEKLQEFPQEAEIAIEELENDQEFYIISFHAGDNRVTIVISDEEEEETE